MSAPSPPHEPSGSKSRARLLTALALGLVPFLALVLRFDFVCDDAFISFRYARNLARGLGLVFNPGVEPPVEGYSEFLWVVLMAIPERLGADTALFARVLSVASGVALVVAVARRLLARFPGQTAAPLVATLFVATLPPLAVWATGGMATMPFAWAVFALHDALFGDPQRPAGRRAALYASLAVLLRADGAWWVAAVAGAGLAIGLGGRRRALLRASFLAAAVSLVVFGVHVAWRWHTYGDILPNTARVKLGFSPRAFDRGGRYLAVMLLTLPSLALALVLGLVAWRRARAHHVLAALVPVLATWLYAVLVGGDFMCFARFLVPSLPFLGLLLGAFLAGVEQRAGAIPTWLVGAGLCALSLLPAFNVHVVPLAWRQPLRFRWNSDSFSTEYEQWVRMRAQAGEWRDLGLAIREHTREGDSVVLGAVGGVGYFSDRFIYDRNGLVTREVAMRPPAEGRKSPGHDKTVEPEFFEKYRPTFLDAFFFPLAWKLPPHLAARGLHGPLRTSAVHPVHGELAMYVQLCK